MLNNLSSCTENEKKMFAIVDKNVEIHIKVSSLFSFTVINFIITCLNCLIIYLIRLKIKKSLP